MDTSPRIRASQEPDGHRQECSQRERTLCQKRSSCLLFQMVGVETYLLLPDDQRDRGNLSCQGETRHRGLPSLSQQSLIEVTEWASSAAGSRGRTLEDRFQVMVVILIQTTKCRGSFGML